MHKPLTVALLSLVAFSATEALAKERPFRCSNFDSSVVFYTTDEGAAAQLGSANGGYDCVRAAKDAPVTPAPTTTTVIKTTTTYKK